jgi:hypothetical protein
MLTQVYTAWNVLTVQETTMKVSKLIEELSTLDPDLEVILSSDPEGNDFSFLDEVAISLFATSGYEIWTVHPDDADEYEDLKEGVVLWP